MRPILFAMFAVTCLICPLVAQEIPDPPEPVAEAEPVAAPQIQEPVRIQFDDGGLMEVGRLHIGRIAGAKLADFSDASKVRLALYPTAGIKYMTSVNAITKTVDLLCFPETPGDYLLVFAMVRDNRLIFIEQPLTVKGRRNDASQASSNSALYDPDGVFPSPKPGDDNTDR